MKPYAEGTEVPVERTRTEIERLLVHRGAHQRAVVNDDNIGRALVIFTLGRAEQSRQIRLEVPLPLLKDQPTARRSPKRSQAEGTRRAWEQACRERWRAVLLLLKAKFAAIDAGVSSIEREFLADIALPDGRTVHAALEEGLRDAYVTGKTPPLLLGRGAPR